MLNKGEKMENIRYKIIVVDDSLAILTMARHILKEMYEVYPAPSAAKFFEILENVLPDLILLDIEMPQINGYEIIKKLKAEPRFADIPVIFLTAKSDENSELLGFNLGAVDYISKPFSNHLLLKRIANQIMIVKQKKELLANQIALKDYADNLAAKVYEKTREVLHLQSAVLTTVADLVEFRDRVTGSHTNRTTRYLRALLEELILEGLYIEEVSKWDIDLFMSSAQLHDVGKIAISDFILNKPGKLTPEEFNIMKTHVTKGMDIIKKIMSLAEENVFLNHALVIVATHHEKWDGSGYPLGLKGWEIPLEGRLMAVADVYDALISVRPYKKAFTHEEASSIIIEGAGIHFDPDLVEIFKKVKNEFDTAAREVGN